MEMRKRLTYTVREVAPYINWIYYFHAWGMEPRFATIASIHDCQACHAGWIASFPKAEQSKAREALKLYEEATAQLHQWADKPLCHGVFLLADAYSEDDDIIIDGATRIPFLRQQQPGMSGYTLCLSDFIRERTPLPTENDADIANRIGVFATSASPNAEVQMQKLCQNGSNETLPNVAVSMELTASLLADRLAEATAEKMHEEVRKLYWGYAKEEELTIKELHDEKFQGIRPAVGYPSLPDQSINFLIDKLLHFEEIGISLSENGAMMPAASVSGFIFAHPKAHYFAIGSIGEDQLHDYSRRRGLGTEDLRNFLIKNL